MNTDLSRFLQIATGSGEAALLTAKHSHKADLETEGFSLALTPTDFTQKSYAIVDANNLKFWYDIAAQFGTGQISWMDEATHEPKARSIDSRMTALVLLVDPKIKDSEPNLGRVTGPALTLA